MKTRVKIYTLSHCPYCVRAKKLLKENGVDFTEVLVSDDDQCTRLELEEKSGMKTFPQIFVGNLLIGGFTELDELNKQKGLKHLINKE